MSETQPPYDDINEPREIFRGEYGICPGCGAEFGLHRLVRIDGKPMPEDDTKLYQCPVCEGQWPKKSLNRHFYSIVTERISKYDHLTGQLQRRSQYATNMFFGHKRREVKP